MSYTSMATISFEVEHDDELPTAEEIAHALTRRLAEFWTFTTVGLDGPGLLDATEITDTFDMEEYNTPQPPDRSDEEER